MTTAVAEASVGGQSARSTAFLPIAAGAALGIAAWATDRLGFPWTAVIPTNAVGAWLALAFLLGTAAGSVWTGALRGLVGLLAAVAAYYLLIALTASGTRAIGATHAATIWGGVAVVAGPILGAAGGAWRHRTSWPRIVGVSILAAGLCAEGVVFGAPRWAHPGELATDPGAITLAVETLIGLALPVLLLPRGERLRGLSVLVGLGLVAGLAINPVIGFLRFLADRF